MAQTNAERQRAYRERKRRDRLCIEGGCAQKVKRWRSVFGPNDRRTGFMTRCTDCHFSRRQKASAYTNVPRARYQALQREVAELRQLVALHAAAPVDVSAVTTGLTTMTEMTRSEYVAIGELAAVTTARHQDVTVEEAVESAISRMALYGTPAVVAVARHFLGDRTGGGPWGLVTAAVSERRGLLDLLDGSDDLPSL